MKVATMDKPSTNITFEGAHAKKLASHKVGAKIKMMVGGVKTSHYQHSDGTHSIGVKVTGVDLQGENEKKGQKEDANIDAL